MIREFLRKVTDSDYYMDMPAPVVAGIIWIVAYGLAYAAVACGFTFGH